MNFDKNLFCSPSVLSHRFYDIAIAEIGKSISQRVISNDFCKGLIENNNL